MLTQIPAEESSVFALQSLHLGSLGVNEVAAVANVVRVAVPLICSKMIFGFFLVFC